MLIILAPSTAADFGQGVYIEDVGSMHGTYVDEERITAHKRHRLYNGELVKFGSEVTRGPGTCLVKDQQPPFCCYQPIGWLSLGHYMERRQTV